MSIANIMFQSSYLSSASSDEPRAACIRAVSSRPFISLAQMLVGPLSVVENRSN
jgi:hypothetical protein